LPKAKAGPTKKMANLAGLPERLYRVTNLKKHNNYVNFTQKAMVAALKRYRI
jgi:hypothetical protein